jgi:ribosomal protein S18 acetylase RimI-like enzyme
MTTIRPFDLRHDLDGMVDLVEIAFAEDEARSGANFRAELQSVKRLLPLILFLQRVSKDFQHVMDGFIGEDQGRIVALVNTSTAGARNKRWEIGNVATHPDYRGQGLARQLVSRAVEHARQQGAEACILEVRSDNEPAYNLYRSLGFVHYDSLINLKLESLPDVQELPFDGYRLRVMKVAEWQARYDLAIRATPAEVQAFLPVNQADFQISPLERLIGPLAERLQRMQIYRWGVEKNDLLEGYTSLTARRAEKVTHRMTMRVAPEARQALTEPMLSLALHTLQDYPRQNLLTSVRKDDQHQLELFKGYGFVETYAMHRLGLKLTVVPSS